MEEQMNGAMRKHDQFCVLPNGIRLCFRLYGPEDGIPLLLIAGISLQLTYWPSNLIKGFANNGFRVIAFDNRDAGRSSRDTTKPPSFLSHLLKRSAPTAYDLQDLAADAIGLLDYLGIRRAHLTGISMGGMIAQTLAAKYPERVISMTSIFSTTGSSSVGQPTLGSIFKLIKTPPRSRMASINRYVSTSLYAGSTRFRMDIDALRSYAAQAWDRGDGARAHEGTSRQIGATIKSGDRTNELKSITIPTLVLHGDVDVMVAPSGGRATADAIPGAKFVTIVGLGHSIPDGAAPLLVDLISTHALDSMNGVIPRAMRFRYA
jgi:pimeloyl-ACP methyl ester carboxylesterase